MEQPIDCPVPRLKNLHEVLADARLECDGVQQVKSFRVDEETYDEAFGICQGNGVTVSAFVRHCLRTLVREYRTP